MFKIKNSGLDQYGKV